MAKRKIRRHRHRRAYLDTELAVVRAARQAVQAVNRNLRATKRKVTGEREAQSYRQEEAEPKLPARGSIEDQTHSAEETRKARCEGNARCEGSAGKPPDERRGAAGALENDSAEKRD